MVSDAGTPASRWPAGPVLRGDEYDERFERLAAAGTMSTGRRTWWRPWAPARSSMPGAAPGGWPWSWRVRGLDVVGTDLDPAMLAVARRKAPTLTWVQGDLATVDLGRQFEAVVLAGNVLLFVTLGTETAVLANAARHLAPGGALVAGFSLGRGLTLAEYDTATASIGLVPDARWATWGRDPFEPGCDYAVSVHRAPARGAVSAPGRSTR